jgi:hypothetical protein
LIDEVHLVPFGKKPGTHGDKGAEVVFVRDASTDGEAATTLEWLDASHLQINDPTRNAPGKALPRFHAYEIRYVPMDNPFAHQVPRRG